MCALSRDRPARRDPPLRTTAVVLPLLVIPLLVIPLLWAACGGGSGASTLELGTLSIRNETDLGQAPQSVTAFYMQPTGVTDPGPDLLSAPIPPGGIVIVGNFLPGLYDAQVVLGGAGDMIFKELEIRAGEPTTLVVPPP